MIIVGLHGRYRLTGFPHGLDRWLSVFTDMTSTPKSYYLLIWCCGHASRGPIVMGRQIGLLITPLPSIRCTPRVPIIRSHITV